MSSQLLTLLMPLKGRHLFTLRFLWQANKFLLPYRILIADGEVHPVIAGLLENPATFPNLDIEYIRYPDDTSFTQFYRKMADASSRLRTPYTMMVDNDDFVIPSGIEPCLEFLTANDDYVSCGGGVAGFALRPASDAALSNLIGPFDRLAYRYSPNYFSRDLASPSLATRVIDGYANYMTTYYNVFRSRAMATICHECADLNFSDLEIHESYFAMRTLVLGKARSNKSCVSYLRQYGTSLGSAFKKDWVHHLLRSRFTTDFDAMVSRISSAVAAADGVDPDPIAEQIRNIFGDGLRILLSRRYGPNPRMEQYKQSVRELIPGWLHDARAWRSRSAAARSAARARDEVFSKLAADGADVTYLRRFEQELESIEETLRGADFPRFVQQHAPDLLKT